MAKKTALISTFLICAVLLSGCSGWFGYEYHYVSGSVSSGSTSAGSSATSSAESTLSTASAASKPVTSKITVTSSGGYKDSRIETSFTPIISQYYYNRLTTKPQRSLYDALLYSLLNLEGKTKTINGSFTDEQIDQVLNAVIADYPQIFYLYYNCSSQKKMEGDKIVAVYFELDYLYSDPGRIPAQQTALYKAVNEILKGAKAYSSVFDRQLYLYEQIISRVSYDFEEITTISTHPYAHSAYGALVEGKAVCDGYAKAFQLLCSYAGIESTIVFGESRSQSHAWNLVWFDGVPYYNDATWDDSAGWYLLNKSLKNASNTLGIFPEGAVILPAAATHTYFNLTYAETTRDHVFDAAYAYPSGGNMAYNYFIKKNLLLTDENWNAKIAEGMRAAKAAGKPFAEFRLGSGVADSGTLGKVGSAITQALADELGITRNVYMTDSIGCPSFAVFLIEK